ncbi:alkene reductase [Mangrovibacterium diazotrophicum]|uniref:N-ethylmaleimide reductase n=1 Tax=Mangrovibacterium diazotrophicum TaxID=1261403 RepID=A0A419VUB8_9BACT|nr:alkene reductase [Mangrovibacterium diazotrophicum]RKD85120.1 N-ethylmaleimide reductase [Mangrovibacterium diazotrophicum]
MENKLFTPLQLGDYELKNRLVMAPLTRMRATAGSLAPHDLNVEYYRQRSSAGLIVTEASQISPLGMGYPLTPGIYSDEQVAGWKKVTDAVHAEDGKTFIQLWHVGRVSHTSLHPEAGLPVAPSAVAAPGMTLTASFEQVPFETPRAITVDEIKQTIHDYRKAAENAKAAGFDGVELHAANGYLLHEFLHETSNLRTDEYGGSIENKARIVFEVLDQLVDVFGAGKVGIRLSPFAYPYGEYDPKSYEVYQYLVEKLNSYKLAYLHLIRYRQGEIENVTAKEEALWKSYDGTIIAADGFTPETAAEYVEAGKADAIAFGRHFIANPDLPKRIELAAELNDYDRNTFYGGAEKGYTDYPFLEKTKA